MPFYDLRCPACEGEQRDVLLKVDEPRACACGTLMEHVWRAKPANVIGDRPFIQENGFKTPREFQNYRELEKALGQQGMEIRAEHKTPQGTDKSAFTTDWAKGCVDRQMLENARILVTRPAEAKPSPASAIELVDAAEAQVHVTWTKRDWPESEA